MPIVYEPRHDNTNKMSVRPAKTQISLGIHPVWSESSLSAWRKLWVFSYPLSAQRRLIRLGGCPGWSESSLGAQLLCCFFHVAAHMLFSPYERLMSLLFVRVQGRFQQFSVISRRCLVATGRPMLTFIVLHYWSIMPQTLDMIQHPVTLSWTGPTSPSSTP